MEVNNLCRCCLDIGNIKIAQTIFEGLCLVEIIQKCTHTQLDLENNLPQNICQGCFDKLATSYLFITKYLEVQESILISDRKTFIEGTTQECLDNTIEILEHELENNIEENTIVSDEEVESNQPLGDSFPSNEDDEPLSKLKLRISAENLQNIDNYKNLNDRLEDSKENLEYTENRKFKNIRIKTKPKNFISDQKKIKRKFFCSKCNESFGFIKLLKKHCRDTGHPIPRRYHCEVCQMKFLTKSCLKTHIRIHNKERPHSCDECGMRFTIRSNLDRHKRRHTGEKAFFCEICGRGFNQKYTLMIHMRLHNGETPYVCQQCGKGYRAKPLLTQHLKKHSGLNTYYREHYLKHGSLKVECPVCNKSLTKSGLYTHMKVQHGDGLKKFLCNRCGKTYSSKKSLETHMNVHTNKVTYSCEICLKAFTHHNYLKTHMRIHSGEKPHCCEICGKTFTQRAHLDGHMRTHTGAKPFTCTYCNKSFALNGNLKVHMRIHTGETPHRCEVCNKGFFDSSNKKKHETTAHQLQHSVL